MSGQPSDATEVWERRPDESDPAWQAFETFREMPPGKRSISEVARQLSKSRPLMVRWASKYGWQMRVAAFDRETDRQWRSSTAHLRREAAEQDAAVARAMLGKVVARLQSVQPENLSMRDLATWVDVATKVRRLAIGEPTDRTEHVDGGSSLDPSVMTPEERRVRLEQLVKEGQRRLHAVPNAK